MFSQVVAVAARKLEDAEEFARKHSICRAYGSYEELARDPDVGQWPGLIHSHHHFLLCYTVHKYSLSYL